MKKGIIIGVVIGVMVAGLGLLGYHVYDVHNGFVDLFNSMQSIVQI